MPDTDSGVNGPQAASPTVSSVSDYAPQVTSSTSLSDLTSSSSTTSTVTSAISTTSTSQRSSNQPADASIASASPSKAASSGNHISVGALAGGIVGAAIGAAILTFVAMYFLTGGFGRKGRSRRESSRSGHGLINEQRVHRHSTPSRSEKPPVTNGWQLYLPQPADDRTIQVTVKTLLDQCELHVDNYYSSKASQCVSDETYRALETIETQDLPATLSDLLTNSPSPTLLIKHCLTHIVTVRITPSQNPGSSLLPLQLASIPSKIDATTSHARQNRAIQQAYSQWKRLSAYLWPTMQQDALYLAHRDQVANATAGVFVRAFEPWATSSRDEIQRHLIDLLISAAEAGILLASQSTTLMFDWEMKKQEGKIHSRDIVVFPGVAKLTDEKGLPLDRAQILVSQVIDRI